MIVIGASLGGINAVKTLLGPIPASFPIPIALVLHRHKDSDDYLREFLSDDLLLKTREVVDKDAIRPGTLYLCPPDYHLLTEPMSFSLSIDDPVQYARPSIDVLFESAADAFGPAAIGIVLTGANHDGAKGAARIERQGGLVLVQEPATAECPVMPAAAIASTRSPRVATLEKMSGLLLELAESRKAIQP